MCVGGGGGVRGARSNFQRAGVKNRKELIELLRFCFFCFFFSNVKQKCISGSEKRHTENC